MWQVRDDGDNPEFRALALTLRQQLLPVVEDINEVLEELRIDTNYT